MRTNLRMIYFQCENLSGIYTHSSKLRNCDKYLCCSHNLVSKDNLNLPKLQRKMHLMFGVVVAVGTPLGITGKLILMSQFLHCLDNPVGLLPHLRCESLQGSNSVGQ